ncbi:MAG: DNA replication/repair protein RecF [Gammaproteobacteria bacterium]|jgi:DNA replication and repair protein RecF
MGIEHLEISHLRNLQHVSLQPASQLNLIIGKNGSGKTSLLEAVHVLGTGRSFRTSNSSKLITFGETQFVVVGKLSHDNYHFPIGIRKSKTELQIRINNEPAKSSSQLAEQLAVQIINPDAHKLFEEGPRHRRRFIEWGVFHVEPQYFPLWHECRHILKQRNAALKQKVPPKELQHWDDLLIEKAERIDQLRRDYLESLQQYLAPLLVKIEALPPATFTLDSGWPKEVSLEEALAGSRHLDYEKGFTRYGPHRLDLRIKVQGINAKEVVSRGQQKIFTALMKIAQVELLRDKRPHSNIALLVDDLPAELDEHFRVALLRLIYEIKAQVFVTATDQSLLPKYTSSEGTSQMFHVEHGQIQPMALD